jgi:hypothetical protein
VVELYNQIEARIIRRCIERGDARTLKELSLLNYEIYLLENSYDVLCFYLKIPFRAPFEEVFKELETLALKAKQNSNYNTFILIFLRYSKEILGKLEQEGVDPVYASYLEHALTSILDLWGCRLCYFQEFLELFQKLLSLHPEKAKALESCLKYNPELKKDDIVLLRTNFKHDLVQKQSELLSLMKTKSMEEVNTALSSLYHQTLYNLDFQHYSRDQLAALVSLLNGNASFGEFFGITERAFKEWNHSVDFTNPHKFIEGEFKYPSFDEAKVAESLRLLNNLCVLEAKSEKDYEQLVKAGSIQRILIGFSSFLLTSDKTAKLVADHELVQRLLVNMLSFLSRTIISQADWEPACLLFSSHLSKFSQKQLPEVIAALKQTVTDNFAAFTIRSLVAIFKNIVRLEEQHGLESRRSTFDCIIDNFMRGTQAKNEEIKYFRFFDASIGEQGRVTKAEEAFLKQYACLNGDLIEPKNPGCFTLSELEIITNPVQFEKVMDNYYFALDKNAKRFLQFLTIDWTESKGESLAATIAILQELLERYPIAIPLLCATRITDNNVASRFIEYVARNVTADSYPITRRIIECRCIRYKNGRDYVREELLPLVLKETVKKINEGSQKVEHFQLLALALKHYPVIDLKADLIQTSLEAIKYHLSKCDSELTAC